MIKSMIEIVRPQRGQVLALSAILLPLLLVVMAFTIELGNIYIHQSRLQTAADSAALAASNKNYEGDREALANTFVILNLSASEKDNLEPFVVVKDEEGDSKYQVTLTEKVQPVFFKYLLEEGVSVSAFAAAEDGKLTK